MSHIRQYDIGTAPFFLMRGRKPQQQMALLYLWNFYLWGKEFTYKSASADAGCPISGATLAELVEEGIIEEVPESERKNSKPCHAYRMVTDIVPDRPEKAPVKPVERPKLPPWVYDACSQWKAAAQGVVGPSRMHSALKEVVDAFGYQRIKEGLVRYGKSTPARFNPSPYKFTATAKQWVHDVRDEPASRSLEDMI